MSFPPSIEQLVAENAELRSRVDDAEETLRAIRSGEVDALVVESDAGPQLFLLQSSDAESNRFRSDILGKVNDAVIAIDGESRVVYLNAAAERQYGVTASQVLGHPATEVNEHRWIRPEDEEAFHQALREKGAWRGKNIHIKRNGETIHIESSVSSLIGPDGSPSGMLAVIRDITDQNIAAEALKESEERYRTLFNSIDEGFCIIEMIFDEQNRPTDYRFLQVSPSFEKQSGLVGAVGKTAKELAPHHEDYWFEIYGKVAVTGESLRYQNHAKELNRHFDLYASRFGDPQKRQVAVVFNDVTERVRKEEALRENEALFSKIIHQAPGGVYVVDDEFRTIQVNALARPTFASAEPVIGRDLLEVMTILWGPVVGKEISEAFRHTLETGGRHISPRFTQMREDLGQEKTYDWETQRLTLPNGRHGVVFYFSDMTEQRQLEDALRASEQLSTNIVQSITDGFLTVDREWRITYLSNRGAEILSPLQKTTSNVLGKVFWDEFPPAVGTLIEENYRRAMDEHVPVQFEAHYPPLDRWFDLRVYPSQSGFSLFFLDITERKEAEAALQANRQLLAEQAAALRTADRSKDEFLAMLAHELRNPLAPLRNATEILQSSAATEQERSYAQQLLARQIENMSRMIDDLLDVSRITEGKIELRKKTVALDAILQGAAAAMRPICSLHGQQFTLALPADKIFLDADATRLEQVFGNLLGNACKYSGEGTHISLAAERVSENEVLVRVSDDGMGIDPEVLPRIFDLFVQSSRTLDRSHGGLGIGLTVVHRLVKLHGGSIKAHSEGLGRGAEFIVRLPVLSPEAATPVAALSRSSVKRSLRMLIVDDNKDAAETMALLQRISGHQTQVAHSGPEAITLASDFLPEVVLLDIGLPGMDGFEVAFHLRSLPHMKQSFLVALTGYDTEGIRERAKAAGFNEHLAKPADLDLLRQWLAGLE